MQVFFIVCLKSVLSLEVQYYHSGAVGIQQTGLTQPHFVPVLIQDTDFQRHLWWCVLPQHPHVRYTKHSLFRFIFWFSFMMYII